MFSADLCGLALVLSSGRAAFVSATNSKLDPKVLLSSIGCGTVLLFFFVLVSEGGVAKGDY